MAVAPTNKRMKVCCYLYFSVHKHSTNANTQTLSITRPFLWGNTAKPLGDVRPEGAPEAHTHSWTVFVRGPNGEDLSYFIKKVVFKLHDTYDSPTRSIE